MEAFFHGYILQVATGSQYLGGFVWTEEAQALWLDDKVEGWRYLMVIMAGVVVKHPQTAYAGLLKSLYQKCDFVQRVTPYIGALFQSVEDELQKAFLLDLFKGATSQIPGRAVTGN